MTEKILVTGGAGFIGSHLVDRLVGQGHAVSVLDSIEPQVHRTSSGHRNPGASYLEGSVLDPGAIRAAGEGATKVVHLAAQVGVGQSMYQVTRYVSENSLGTAVLLETLADMSPAIQALVVASSMSIYGEGQYACPQGHEHGEFTRSHEQLLAREWQPRCVRCGCEGEAMPTSEEKPLRVDSIYAVTKRDHEELCLIFGRSRGIRTIALRFFNVYGPRQSLSNPYTGVAAIFSSRLLNGQPPLIFEDGLQSRDFVHVSDIVQAIELSLAANDVGDVALNVGTGEPTTVADVAEGLAKELGLAITPHALGQFRQGDVRHCYADISRARRLLGYQPQVAFGAGLRELVDWIRTDAPPSEDLTARAGEELAQRGLVW
ncbi:MAG: SDR family NAD(P)-dependent oxidoreductase [Actinomycetota bacterium]